MKELYKALDDFVWKTRKRYNNQCIVLYYYEQVYCDKIMYFNNT